MSLRATHQGYTYQDLVAAIGLVDLLLGTASRVSIDTKGFDGDRFDDLTLTYRDGRRVRIQVKHTAQHRPLSRATFSADQRSLRLDLLAGSVLRDLRDRPGTSYRVIVRDGPPDTALGEVLQQVPREVDPGDPFPGFATRRYRFDPAALRARRPWRELVADLSGEDLETACHHLTIDAVAPSSTIDMTAPGPAELMLLRRVTEELGAGRPPNTRRSPEDVAVALIYAATAARSGNGDVGREDIAPRIGLTTDFGAVAEGHPVEAAVAVTRTAAIGTVRRHVEEAAAGGGRVVLVGEPGAGKSWLCEQLTETCTDDGWVVARHHCWLGATDRDRHERVLTDVVIGSLLAQLERLVPEAISAVRPRFAATAETLESAVAACRAVRPDRRVLLIVDGLDHVDRVIGRRTTGHADPSRLLVDEIARVLLPPGTAMLIASQPGPHLANARPTEAGPVEMPHLSREELRSLAQRHHLIGTEGAAGELEEARAIVSILEERSSGNALYATYLCRQASRLSPLVRDGGLPPSAAEVIHLLRQVPAVTTDLGAYYDHLLAGLTGDQKMAVGILSLCGFALTSEELCEMLPEAAPFIGPALSALAPVLNSQPGLGGLRVHHESFSRHVVRDQPREWIELILQKSVSWLVARGFFSDSRAFRHLPGLYAELGDWEKLKSLLRPGFVADAIKALQPPSALKRVVGAVARDAEMRLDWPTLVACVETRKAVDTYEQEALPDTLVRYAAVVVSILGANAVNERMLYDGATTFPARWGLHLCNAVDRAGGSAPWQAYLDALKREQQEESTRYSSDEEAELHLVVQLGHLRVRGQTLDFGDDMIERVAENLDSYEDDNLDELVEVFTRGLPAGSMPDVAGAMGDPLKAARVYLALADLAEGGMRELPSPGELAREAQRRSPSGDISRYLRYGLAPEEVLAGLGRADFESELRAATAAITSERSPQQAALKHWVSMLALAHALDPGVPLKLTSDLAGAGFYRAFLRFTATTVGIAADVTRGVLASEAGSSAVCMALASLAGAAHPFTGKPRACDLYFVHPVIHEVLEGVLVAVQHRDLDQALGHLVTISDGTTTSLMGMAANGPLAMNDLLAILARVSKYIGASATHALLARFRGGRQDAGGLYSVAADYELATARICVAAGADGEASDCWDRAAVLLGSYGGHKDPTISEFIESVDDLSTVDVLRARVALERLLDPVYLVLQHTDGRGTNHLARAWWETCARIDPIAAALDGAALLVDEPGFSDARVQAGLEELLRTQCASVDPFIGASLRLAAGSEWRDPAVDLEVLGRLGSQGGLGGPERALVATIANNIAASYDDQPLMFARDMSKSIATSELVSAVVGLGGSAFEPRPAREEEERRSPLVERREKPTDVLRLLEARQRPLLPSGPSGAIAAAREYQKKDYSDDSSAARWDPEALASAIGWRVLEVTEKSGAEAGIELLRGVAREMSPYSENGVFATIGDGLAMRADHARSATATVAAFCLTLAFIRIRGGGGWRSFAGRQRADLWSRAYSLDPEMAERTLAGAVAATADASERGSYGVTQAVIAALAVQPTSSPGGTAFDCWESGFAVLEARLPGEASRGGHVYTASLSLSDSAVLEAALATLVVATVSRGARADIRRALLAASTLVMCRPEAGQLALARVLGHGLDSGRATWLLEILRDCSPDGVLAPELELVLARLAQCDLLSVRVRAAEILAARDLPVPAPPVAEARAELRVAIGRFFEDAR